MSARKSRQSPAADPLVETRPDVDETGAVNEIVAGNSRGSRFRLAAGLFALWFALLAGLAFWTANPVTLNRQQLRHADIVVQATVDNITTGQCTIVQSWPAGAAGEVVMVKGLDGIPIVIGESYVLALQRDPQGNGYTIVTTAPPESAQLVYPATDDSLRQVSEVLDATE